MIRRFFGMIVFTVTVLTASFGQNIFGRADIIALANHAREEGPKHASRALEKTDIFLSHLGTKA